MSIRSMDVGTDPLTDVVTRAITIPLRELYAVLWRVGVVEIVDSPAEVDNVALPREIHRRNRR